MKIHIVVTFREKKRSKWKGVEDGFLLYCFTFIPAYG